MKKILSFIIITALLFTLCGCIKTTKKANSKNSEKPALAEEKTNRSFINGVWVSCFETDEMLKTGDFENEFLRCAENCKSSGITDLFVHTVAYCDCIYKSQFYPFRSSALNCDYDILEKMIEICHGKGLKFHAWINPYRVRTADKNIAALPQDSMAKKWYENGSKDNICFADGIYLNPAKQEVRKLILDGIRETLNNYDVDGIHFDDYFYPTTDENFDKDTYLSYKNSSPNALSLAEWRRTSVNSLISECRNVIKYIKKDVVFSISPSASKERNFNEYYADIDFWCKSGYADYIIPQLYFGFDYPNQKFCFNNLLNVWEETVKDTDVKLLIGLASYKIETEQKPDCEEWKDYKTIVKECEICLNDLNIGGTVYFSYDSLFSENQANKTALSEIKALVDTKTQK